MNKAISPNVELGKDTLLPQNSDILKDFANVKSFFLEIKITHAMFTTRIIFLKFYANSANKSQEYN